MKSPIPKVPKDRAMSGVPLVLGSFFENVVDVVGMMEFGGRKILIFERMFDVDQINRA